MNAEHLLAHYERIADAPDAVSRLRRFILDLAVRGKLVPQDPKDEPASELLKRLKKGLSKSSRKASRTGNNEVTAPEYNLPSSWLWVRIGDHLELVNGMAFKPTDWQQTGIKIVRIQNLNRLDAPFNYCDSKTVRDRFLIDDGAFLISWSGTPGTSFGAFIWDRGSAVLNQHIFRCDFRLKAFDPRYLRLAINGRLDEMIAKAHGGVGLQHITKGKLEALLITLPPLAEQNRIVAKVNELTVLCDRLEAARAEREMVRDGLTAASLARLNTPDPDTFQSDARFAMDALPALTARPDQIKQLRQTVLNLAVRGKLVPQEAGDEPASELLKRIAAEKARLIKKGEVKKEKPLEAITDVIKPFDIPDGWEWVRLDVLTQLITKGSSPKWQGVNYASADEGLLFITSENVGSYELRKLDELKYVEARFREIEPRSMLKTGDILMNLVGASIGRTALYDLTTEANINQAVALIRLIELHEGPSVDYLLHYLNAPSAVEFMLGSRVTSAQPNMSLTDTREFPVPLPPLAEQHRIVSKVDELIALCDRLETSLMTGEDTRSRLLEALLAGALTPAEARERQAAE